MRGVPRWLAVLAVVAIAAVVCAFTVHRALTPATFVLRLSDVALPADGFSSTDLAIRSSNGRASARLGSPGCRSARHGCGRPPFARSARVVVDSLTVDHDSATASLRAGVLPGETKLRITAPGFTPQESQFADDTRH